MHRLSLALILTTCLGGCGLLGSTPVAKRSLEAELTAQNAARSPADSSDRSAMALLPPDAGRIQKISRQSFADGTQQLIGYDHSVAGLKPNEIRISIATAVSTTRLEQAAGPAAPRDKPTEAGIRAALAGEFPRMPMRIVSPPRSNDYGVYGLAVGQWANGARCIYAWQWIESLKSAEDGTTASLRIRLCRSDMTLDQLADFVDHLRIDPARREIDVAPATAESTAPPPPTRKPPAAAAAEKAIEKPVATTRPPTQRLAARAAAPFLTPQAASPDAVSEPNPDLPAAAYRGPSNNARTASQ